MAPESSLGRLPRTWLAASLLLILLAAWRSSGYAQSDEQFQVLEFASSKLGRTPVDALPWEHGLRMRGWLQPALYLAVIRALERFSVRDPFVWAAVLRAVSACGDGSPSSPSPPPL